MRALTWFVSAMILFAAMQTANAARPLGPPVEELLRDPGRIRVAAVVAADTSASSQLKFTVIEQISGDSPDELSLRANQDTAADVVAGGKYIIAWTDQRKVRLLREGYEKDPDGPSIIQVRGLSSQALYEDSPEIRFLFTSRAKPGSLDAPQQIDALLKQAQREDNRSRDLVVGQLYLSPELGGQMSREQADKLMNILQSDGLSAEHRDYLLQVALRLPGELRSPWLGEEFRKVIILHGTQYDLTTFVPGLVKTSATGLRQTGEAADIALLSLLLYANNPGVSKAALATMDHFDKQLTMKNAQEALKRGWIHIQTRRALEQYLKKFDSK